MIPQSSRCRAAGRAGLSRSVAEPTPARRLARASPLNRTDPLTIPLAGINRQRKSERMPGLLQQLRKLPGRAVNRASRAGALGEGGFSLVEVVLAVGVVAFGLVAIFALIPAGLGVFRQAMDTSVGSQIVQRIASDAAQSDFDLLVPPGGAGEFFVLPMRCFDDQGVEVNVAAANVPSAAEKVRIVYTVWVRGAKPGAADPESHTNDYFTSLPSTGTRFNPRSLTLLTVQIVHNPAARDLQSQGVIDPATSLIDPRKAAARGLPVRTYPIAVARNSSPPRPSGPDDR